MRKICAGFVLLFTLTLSARAIEPFVVEDIEVEGLQRVSAGTVFNYLPIKVGDEVDDEIARGAIKALFGTDLFEDVALRKEDSTLIVTVEERPTIANVELVGLDELDEDATREQLRNTGLGKGRIFNPSLLDKVVQEIKSQYFSIGKYAAEVETEVTPLDSNRVNIKFNVREGETATIKRVNIVGNEAFTEEELKDEFTLSTERRFIFLPPKDEYSRQQLQADLEALRSFYQDKGYLNFEVESTQVTISPDKEDIFVTVNIDEGEQYTVSDFAVKGRLIVPEKELVNLVTIEPGEVYSQRAVSESREAIVDRLGDDGYAFANVNAIPRVNEEENTVSVDLVVDPGRRVYVRRINISGNRVTRDEVIRREMRQLEGGWYSTERVQRSTTRLDRTGYFSQVTIDTESVPGSPDQVDVNVNVEERSTGSILVGIGYSDADGILLQGEVSQNNLFGTGRQLSFVADDSSVTRRLQLRYLNPYWTINGVSRGFTLFRREIDAEEADTAAYVTDTLGAGVDFGFPLTEFTSFNIGGQAERVELKSTLDTPDEFLEFIEESPENDILKLTGNFTHDSRDSRLFPTKGSIQRLSWEVSTPPSDLEYYKLTARNDSYLSLTDFLIFKASAEVGYGDGYSDTDDLPFFENFFAGGANTVRGYDARSLGPRDSGGTPEALGGDRRILGNVELMFPLPGEGGEDKRISFFVDGGQVYGPGADLDFGDLRYSAGIAFSWFSPLGPLALSLAEPLNDEPGDDIQRIQFTLGRFFQ